MSWPETNVRPDEWEAAGSVSEVVEVAAPEDQQLRLAFEVAYRELYLDLASSDHRFSPELTVLGKAALANLYSRKAEDGAIIKSRQFVLKNPRRMGLQNVGFDERSRLARPEVNSRTGDLKWEPSADNRFASILPKIEETSTEPKPKAVGDWSYGEFTDFLGVLNISTDLEEADWRRRSPEEKGKKLDSILARSGGTVEELITIEELIDKFPMEAGEVKRRVGVEVVEVGPSGEMVETFSIYIVRNPSFSPLQAYIGSRSGGQQEWQVVVRCASGSETIYNWGDGDGQQYNQVPLVRKPVIYLYPAQATQVSVNLDFTRGPVVVEYPKREGGAWKVEAQPDGRLLVGGKEYPYLFWEAKPTTPYQFDQTEGFCLGKEEFVPFFEEKLKFLGLNDREITDFITYWYPLMKSNQYTYVNFLGQEYLDSAKLTVSPAPETSIRVFVVFRSMAQKANLKPQELVKGQRNGFTLVEWGGSNLDEK